MTVLAIPLRQVHRPAPLPTDTLSVQQTVAALRRTRPLRHTRREYYVLPDDATDSFPHGGGGGGRPSAAVSAAAALAFRTPGAYISRPAALAARDTAAEGCTFSGALANMLEHPRTTCADAHADNLRVQHDARKAARGAGGAMPRKRGGGSRGAAYFFSTMERLQAEAKTFEQTQFRFAVSNDPYLYTPHDSRTTSVFYRPQGAQLTDARRVSGNKVTRIVAGVNDTLFYRWIDMEQTVFAVTLSPSVVSDPDDFYDVYALNGDLERAMLRNGHYVLVNGAPRFLLRIQFDILSGRLVVAAGVFRSNTYSTPPAATTTTWIDGASPALFLGAPPDGAETDADAAAAAAANVLASSLGGEPSGATFPAADTPIDGDGVRSAHLPRYTYITSNMPVLPHLYTNRSFACTGNVAADESTRRKQVDAINTTAGVMAARNNMGLGLGHGIVFQRAMQYPLTRKERLYVPPKCNTQYPQCTNFGQYAVPVSV